MDSDRKSEGVDLREARERAGLSRDQVAVRLGVESRSIWRWERLGTKPKNRIIRRRYEKLLGV